MFIAFLHSTTTHPTTCVPSGEANKDRKRRESESVGNFPFHIFVLLLAGSVLLFFLFSSVSLSSDEGGAAEVEKVIKVDSCNFGVGLSLSHLLDFIARKIRLSSAAHCGSSWVLLIVLLPHSQKPENLHRAWRKKVKKERREDMKNYDRSEVTKFICTFACDMCALFSLHVQRQFVIIFFSHPLVYRAFEARWAIESSHKLFF